MRFAERMNHIKASGVRSFFDKGRQIANAIDLSIGQADFDVPEAVRAATVKAIHEGCGRYTGTQGIPELVEATREHLVQEFGLPPGDEVMMTTGASGGIATALLSRVGPGDEVLVPDPHFVIYDTLVRMAGALPVYYDLYPDFRLPLARIEEAMTRRTALLILNSPANPTGAMFCPEEVHAVADLCAERQIPVISDELYKMFVYDGANTSIKRFPQCESVLIGGFSKAYGMAGWRLGWAAAHPDWIEQMKTVQQMAYACPPTLVQHGALAAFDVDQTAIIDSYRKKRDMMYEGLIAADYNVAKPAGSFFMFPTTPWGDDMTFCEKALEEKLILVPGRSFSRRKIHFRLSFAASDATLERGLEALRRLSRAGV